MKVKYDVRNVERGGGPQPDPGLYTAKITKAEVSRNKADTGDNLVITFKITSSKKFKGATLRTWVAGQGSTLAKWEPSESSEWKFAELIDAVLGKSGAKGSVELEGSSLQIKVDGSEYEGQYQAKVGKLTALPGSDDDDDESDDDEESDDDADDDSDDADEESESGDDDEPDGYDDMSIKDLRSECKDRELEFTSKHKKEALIELLREDDDPFGND